MPDQKTPESLPLLVVVTGLSGAGLSTALRALQDSGFYCIDNLPVELFDQTLDLISGGKIKARGFAFGMDIRDEKFAAAFPGLNQKLQKKIRIDTIFLSADEKTLLARFGATRRKHPLMPAEGGSLREAIRREAEILAPLEAAADAAFDTSNWSPQALMSAIETRYHKAIQVRRLHVTICSFGFKHGQLRPADMLFDARFLPNPHFVLDLRARSGLEPAVRKMIMEDPLGREFFNRLEDMCRFLLPQFFAEGKHYLRIGIGCTGGFHRSVCLAEELGAALRRKPLANIEIAVEHRDLLTSAP
ncbi:MAG: hypothetical protein RIQ81_1662 [Pseudomonadota bacterium]|jgi:UPF0042 nucleotide-binding protein